ncbi:eCIS core domain-containing protein [Actinoalloteichus hymeniacidonis]|nr:DUF4157 domain-containing protein [Actinoalloteichus hymeniacidonis]MBB5911047.1 hypothetical protein [Actinoalloteichus hymeniacidonis]
MQRSTVPDVLGSTGRALDENVRLEMQNRLGADFADVRLHTGSAAQRSAAEIGARAYTSGNHVVIGAGGADKHTLAHELTHVIQQRSGPVAGADHGDGFSISDPDDRFERAAEANATRVMNRPVPNSTDATAAEQLQYSSASSVQRLPQPGDRITIQRASVAGVSNKQKDARAIGDDVHRLIQGEFREDFELRRRFSLDVEVPVGGGRADLVAFHDEREDGAASHGSHAGLTIFVGEIKSMSEQYYGNGGSDAQLDRYIEAFRAEYPGAKVQKLNFWYPESDGFEMRYDGYDCTVHVENAGEGIYRYSGRVKLESISAKSAALDDVDERPMPFV